LFSQIRAALAGEPIPADPDGPSQRACLIKHYDLVVERFGHQKGTMLMRKFACCYAQGRHGARQFRTHAALVRTPAEFHQVVEHYFPM
jgi:tRNA-dihydrouridine synthase B